MYYEMGTGWEPVPEPEVPIAAPVIEEEPDVPIVEEEPEVPIVEEEEEEPIEEDDGDVPVARSAALIEEALNAGAASTPSLQ